jgi:hypothetical protein
MEAVNTSETSVNVYRTTQRNISTQSGRSVRVTTHFLEPRIRISGPLPHALYTPSLCCLCAWTVLLLSANTHWLPGNGDFLKVEIVHTSEEMVCKQKTLLHRSTQDSLIHSGTHGRYWQSFYSRRSCNLHLRLCWELTVCRPTQERKWTLTLVSRSVLQVRNILVRVFCTHTN